MIKIVGAMTCQDVSYEADPYTPLTVSWRIRVDDAPLYLYVRGEDHGYVELKVDPKTLALCKLILIDLPPPTDRSLSSALEHEGGLSPVLDRAQWVWRVTPDYEEPLRRDVDITERLYYSKSRDTFVLWFCGAPSARYLACSNAIVGVSADNEMVCVAVPTPPVVEPAGYPHRPMQRG